MSYNYKAWGGFAIGVYSGTRFVPCALRVSIAIFENRVYDRRRDGRTYFDWLYLESGRSVVVYATCRCSLAKLERFAAARPLQFSSIRSDHLPWSRARFLSGIVQPISTSSQGTCCHRFPPASPSFLLVTYSIHTPIFQQFFFISYLVRLPRRFMLPRRSIWVITIENFCVCYTLHVI